MTEDRFPDIEIPPPEDPQVVDPPAPPAEPNAAPPPHPHPSTTQPGRELVIPADQLTEAEVVEYALRDANARPQLIALLDPGHFQVKELRSIWVALQRAFAGGLTITPAVLMTCARDAGQEVDATFVGMLLDSTRPIPNKATLSHLAARLEASRLCHSVGTGPMNKALEAIAKGDFGAFTTELRSAITIVEAKRGAGEDGLRITSVGADWYSAPPPPMQWLLRDVRGGSGEGRLPRGKVGMLVGPGGSGKTQAICQLALAIGTRTPWLGAWSPDEPGRVLLLLGEEDADEARRRLHRASAATATISLTRLSEGLRQEIPPADAIHVAALTGVDCALLARGKQGDPVETDFLRRLRDRIAREQYAFVAADPLSRFAGGEAETSNSWGTRFVEALESLTVAGASILCAHHTSQWARQAGARERFDETTKARGVTGLTDGARWSALLDVERYEHADPAIAARLSEIVSVRVTKSNYGPKGPPILCRRSFEFGGALIALTQEERAQVERSSSGEDKTSKREAARSEATHTQHEADDAAARALRVEMPGATHRDLTAALRARCRCGTGRADAALRRTRPDEGATPKEADEDDGSIPY